MSAQNIRRAFKERPYGIIRNYGINNMIEKDDCRLMGQEKYLAGKELFFVPDYRPFSKTWEHEHCVFCTAKISSYKGDIHQGYCTADEKRPHWICKDCFEDFKDMFNWVVVNKE